MDEAESGKRKASRGGSSLHLGGVGVLPSEAIDAITDETRAALLGGDFATMRTALTGRGASASAFTTPVFVDFDGGGYRAPFAP